MNVGAIDNVDSLYITSIGVHCVKSVETLGCLLLYILIIKSYSKERKRNLQRYSCICFASSEVIIIIIMMIIIK